MSTSPIPSPQFRVYFALQQAVLLEKARTTQAQVFSRFSLPQELRLAGSFTLFVTLLSQLIRLGLNSYPVTAANRLVFVTADYLADQLTIRITDGGSGLRYQTTSRLGDTVTDHTRLTPQRILTEAELITRGSFHGQLSIRSFQHRGTQLTLELPVPTDSQIPGRS
jgi:hypothetical protein